MIEVFATTAWYVYGIAEADPALERLSGIETIRRGSLAALVRELACASGAAGMIGGQVLDIELLTIRLRLLVASADKAREMGIDWWENDPFYSSRALKHGDGVEARLRALEAKARLPTSREEE